MTKPRVRYHYLDQVRAHMMLLGIVFHTAPSYMKPDPELPWAFTDPVSHPGLFVMMVVIHLFRMPVFMLVAGFFCALMIERWGVDHLVLDRFKRITLPFLVLVGPIFLLCSFIVDYSAEVTPPPVGRERIFDDFIPSYLWFLYYLSIYYVLVVLAYHLTRASWRNRLRQWTQQRSFLQLMLLCSGVTASTVVTMNVVFVPAPIHWSLNAGVFIYYAGFFCLGMALYGHPVMSRYAPGRLWKLALATAVTVGICCALYQPRNYFSGITDTLLETLWGIIFGFAAVFGSMLAIAVYQRYFAQESVLGRYIADAAYWVYLAHFPLTLWLPVVLFDVPLAPTLKFLIVIVVTTLLCVLSYHFLVRSTWLGAWLNGKRKYPTQYDASQKTPRHQQRPPVPRTGLLPESTSPASPHRQSQTPPSDAGATTPIIQENSPHCYPP